MPVTAPLPDGPFAPGAGTPGPDVADIVAFLTQKGNATDGEVQAAAVEQAGTAASATYVALAPVPTRNPLTGHFQPEGFGAVGDGVADDTAAVQACIDAAIGAHVITNGVKQARTATGSVLLLNKYKITSQLKVESVLNLEIRGANAGSSALYWAGPADAPALLYLNGLYNCDITDLTLIAVSGVTTKVTDVISLQWDPTTVSRSTSGNNFERLVFRNIIWSNAALNIGGYSPGIQVDNGTYRDISINGQRAAGDLLLYQYGVQVGSGSAGNNLNHFFYGLTVAKCRYNFWHRNVPNVAVFGGSFGNSEADVKQDGVGPLTLDSIRSEDSERFFIQGGGASFPVQVAMRNVLFSALNLNADNKWIKLAYGGEVTLESVVISQVASFAVIECTPTVPLSVTAIGCDSARAVESFVSQNSFTSLTMVGYTRTNTSTGAALTTTPLFVRTADSDLGVTFGSAAAQVKLGSLGTADAWIDASGTGANVALNLRAKGGGSVNSRSPHSFLSTVGFNGASPVGKRTLGAAAIDAASTQVLANNLRQALIDLGLGQT